MLVDLRQLTEDVTALAGAPVWPLSDDEIREALRVAHRLEQAATALQARLAQQAITRNLPASEGHRSTARWLSSLLLLDPQPARDLAEAAAALHRPAIEEALLDGRIDLRQTAAIAAATDAIPADLADFDDLPLGAVAEITDRAEQTMIDMADRLAAHQLRRVGERILSHVAPQLAEQADEAALARQEARAHRRRGLTLSLPFDGLSRLSGALGTEDTATLNAALHSLCQPVPDDDRTPAQRRADALIDVCRLALRTQELPHDGGEPPQLAVTVAYQPLADALAGADEAQGGQPHPHRAHAATSTTATGTAVANRTGRPHRAVPASGRQRVHPLGIGHTDTGRRVSAATVRQLACDARILPVVLGSAGQILDVGRARRLATGALRRALHIRDQGCAYPHCDRPPRWTDSHHITAWTDGGTTTLDNLVLLCRHHHRLFHRPDNGWQIRIGADRRPEFIPPATIDPAQQPRRNLYHLRH